MNNIAVYLQQFQRWLGTHLTLRVKLSLLSTILVIVCTLALILIINLMAIYRTRADFSTPDSIVVLVTSTSSDDLPIAVWAETPLPPQAIREGSNDRTVQSQLMELVQRISFLGFLIVAILGGFTSYWMIGYALKPIGTISQTARKVYAKNLNKRLAFYGPQDEVKELADAFDGMLIRLEHAFEQQGQFVLNAAHELRTPLTALRANLEVLQADTDASIQDYWETANILERSLTRLEQLVCNLLLLAKGEGEIIQEPIVLGAALEEVVLELTPLSREKQVLVELGGDSELVIFGDISLLSRAFSNLIENAIIYNHPGGRVDIRLFLENSQIVISITDTGIGINPNEKERIFERFYRVNDSCERHPGGVGLGLSIVAHVVQLHNGKIRVEDGPQGGTKFSLYLPLKNT